MKTSPYYPLIKHSYENSQGDSTELFRTILSIAGEAGTENILAILETCIIEKRLSWWNQIGKNVWANTGNPINDGYRLFYENYLGLRIPGDGEIIKVTDKRLVMRWWNQCPTLDACQKFGLNTREICRKAYHKPVAILLSKIDPRLNFERNYSSIRPYTTYCEEIISLKG
jgi:hypothetical protein